MTDRKRDYLARLLLLLPAFAFFAVFVVFPFLSSLSYSLTDWDGVSRPTFTGLLNYERLFSERAFLKALLNTLIFSGVSLCVATPLGMLFAVLLNGRVRGRSFLRSAIYLPQVLSMMVISVVWTLIFAEKGPVNALAALVGLGGATRDWLAYFGTALPALQVIMVWQSVGLGTVIFLAGIQTIPPELYEAGALDGISGWQKFRRITLPMIMPTVTIVTFLSLAGSLKIFDLPYIMTNGGPGNATRTLALMVYSQAFVDMNYGYATASGIVLFVFVSAASLLQIRVTRSREIEA
jgi:raffinose/stachyose/melibiose transport system permease protein